MEMWATRRSQSSRSRSRGLPGVARVTQALDQIGRHRIAPASKVRVLRKCFANRDEVRIRCDVSTQLAQFVQRRPSGVAQRCRYEAQYQRLLGEAACGLSFVLKRLPEIGDHANIGGRQSFLKCNQRVEACEECIGQYDWRALDRISHCLVLACPAAA